MFSYLIAGRCHTSNLLIKENGTIPISDPIFVVILSLASSIRQKNSFRLFD